MKTFLVIAAALACASAMPKSDNGMGSWSDNGMGSWPGNGQEWESWLGNGQDWMNGREILNRNAAPSLDNLCQLLQLINNGVQWPACSQTTANRAPAEMRALTAASLAQLCQLLQSINNGVNWPACQISRSTVAVF